MGALQEYGDRLESLLREGVDEAVEIGSGHLVTASLACALRDATRGELSGAEIVRLYVIALINAPET